jgi:hypothetical protein
MILLGADGSILAEKLESYDECDELEARVQLQIDQGMHWTQMPMETISYVRSRYEWGSPSVASVG